MTTRAGGKLAGINSAFASATEGTFRYHPGTLLSIANIVFTPVSGPGTISGTVTLNGVYEVTMRVLLLQENRALPLALQQVGVGGTYTFDNLPAGKYAIVVVDTTGAYRSKVVHTVIP